MSGRDYYKHGDWNAICQICGFKFKASELRMEWDNLRVCRECWSPRQPQDFVRGVADIQSPPWTLPNPPPTFVPSAAALPMPDPIAPIPGQTAPFSEV